MEPITFHHNNTELLLNSNKTITVPDSNLLIIADLHLGKTTHFRKNGIPIPSLSKNKDLEKLDELLKQTPACNVVFLGDLFHSEHNSEWAQMEKILIMNPLHTYHLVEGNHDILHRYEYENAGIQWHESHLIVGDLLLSHEPMMEIENRFLNICGHIHPGYLLSGRARTHLRLPCFYNDGKHLLMPAFGELTGLKLMPPPQKGKVFPIGDGKIFELSFGLV